MPEASEDSYVTYYIFCPKCGSDHEYDSSKIGEVIECICGTNFKVVK